jgi:hypothetical protein
MDLIAEGFDLQFKELSLWAIITTSHRKLTKPSALLSGGTNMACDGDVSQRACWPVR